MSLDLISCVYKLQHKAGETRGFSVQNIQDVYIYGKIPLWGLNPGPSTNNFWKWVQVKHVNF